MYFDQREYDIRLEWGLPGLRALAPVSDVVIIVDVLSFSTSVDIVVARGGAVHPYAGDLEAVEAYAASLGAKSASRTRQRQAGLSLSPSSLTKIPKGTKLVLPSPNGSLLSLAAGEAYALAGCLRNAKRVGQRANQLGRRISVIAAGERWKDGRLRPGLEDLLGAGAVITHLAGTRSPEAESATAVFDSAQADLMDILRRCSSGKELVGRGFADDVELAGQLDVSDSAPVLVNGAYVSD